MEGLAVPYDLFFFLPLSPRVGVAKAATRNEKYFRSVGSEALLSPSQHPPSYTRGGSE